MKIIPLAILMMQASAMAAASLEQIAGKHPAGEVLMRLFAQPAAPPGDFKATGLTRKDYLPLIAGNVDFWKNFQDDAGAIIDPYEKKEKQYSTPAFAVSSALLVEQAKRGDLLEAAERAMSFALTALVDRTTADGHADFYIPMLVHARRLLNTHVRPEQLQKWDEQFRSLVPEKSYRDVEGNGNWNLVNISGEYLRRKDGLLGEDQKDAQLQYFEKCLNTQAAQMTRYGMYHDAGFPLAYDAFPRLWMEDALEDDAVVGEWKNKFEDWLSMGALSGLLLLSPSGEWACGGRSAHHQWNEAANAEIAEINAARWKRAGRADIAGAFKRAAHLCLASMNRWQRPSGEMWIVKNFADPARRHGFEGYSFHSQYNLLPMGMLAIAYAWAGESIEERPMPSESAGYVFDLREEFHHIVAACGGYYVLIDTGADPHYGSTGLQRVHRRGVDLSPLTDTPGPEAGYGPADAKNRSAMVTGMEWREKGSNDWHSLGDYGVAHSTTRPEKMTEKADLEIKQQGADRVHFIVRYHTAGEGARPVEEEYIINSDAVEVTVRILGESAPSGCRVVLPAMVNDAARDTDVSVSGRKVRIARQGALFKDVVKPGGVMVWEVVAPDRGVKLELEGPAVATHNGYVRALAGELPAGVREVKWKLTLEPNPGK